MFYVVAGPTGGVRTVAQITATSDCKSQGQQRSLLPEAYGTITILVSIPFVIGNIIDTSVRGSRTMRRPRSNRSSEKTI